MENGLRIARHDQACGTCFGNWRTEAEEERLTSGEGTQTVGSFSPDGKWLAFVDNPGSANELWVMPLDANRKPQVFLKTSFNIYNPRFSPDGGWLAYTSSESGRDEVYVRRFRDTGGKWQISTDGGNAANWSRDGHELFYLNGNKMMAVAIRTQPSFVAGAPKLLYEERYSFSPTNSAGYDVSVDGRRFLRAQPVEPEQVATQINVVLNWTEELRQRVPTK
jgi:Tol biopolymer transport system component